MKGALTLSHKHIKKKKKTKNRTSICKLLARTSAECWQKSLNLQKEQETLDITGRRKEKKRKKESGWH